MTTQPNDGLLYLQTYPALWRWINRCAACQHLGHKPDLPAQLGEGIAARNLRRYFREMAVDQTGLCDQCARATEKKRESN